MIHQKTPITFLKPETKQLDPRGGKVTTYVPQPIVYTATYQGIISSDAQGVTINDNRDTTKQYITVYIRRMPAPPNLNTKWRLIYRDETYSIESAIIDQQSQGLPWHIITRITAVKIEG